MYSPIATNAPVSLDDAFVQAVLNEHNAIVERSHASQTIRTGNAPYAVTRPATVQNWTEKNN